MPAFPSSPGSFTLGPNAPTTEAVSFGPIPTGPYVSGTWELAHTTSGNVVYSYPIVTTARGNACQFPKQPRGASDDTIPVTAQQLAEINALANNASLSATYQLAGLLAIPGFGDDVTALTLTLVGCTEMISPTSAAYGPAGGSGTIAVTTSGSLCPWTAVSNNPWITVTSGSAGTGNGSVGYSVAANAGPPRTGTITVAGQIFTVMQDACGCSLSPTGAHYPSGGGAGQFSYSTMGGCAWSAVSSAPWLHTSSSGNGAGTVSYTLDPQADPSLPRSATITVGNCVFTVTQDGIPASVVTVQVRSDPEEAGVHQVITVNFPFGYVPGVNLDACAGTLKGAPEAPPIWLVSGASGALYVVDSANCLRVYDPILGTELPAGAPMGAVTIWRIGG